MKQKAKRVHNPNYTQENKESSKNATPLDQSSLEKFDKQHIFDKTNGLTISINVIFFIFRSIKWWINLSIYCWRKESSNDWKDYNSW